MDTITVKMLVNDGITIEGKPMYPAGEEIQMPYDYGLFLIRVNKAMMPVDPDNALSLWIMPDVVREKMIKPRRKKVKD